MVTPNNVRRKRGANSRSHLDSSQCKAVATVTSSLSGEVDAIQLRDQLVHLRKEMNALKKEKDIAKAQQVFKLCVCMSIYIVATACANYTIYCVG